MSNLVPLGQSSKGAIALHGNQPVAIVEGEIIPLQSRESFQLAECLLKNLVPAHQVSEAVESALAIERSSNHQLMLAMQDVVETAVGSMSLSHQSLLQQNQQLLQQNQQLVTALVEKPTTASDRGSSQTTVIVERWGQYDDPMPAIGLMFFATIVTLVAMGLMSMHRSNQTSPQPAYQSSVMGVHHA